MILSIILLIVGAALILLGADALTGGASDIARHFGISELMVGLTVVAFGTSMPEFAVSVISAIDGKAQMAIGNVVGSNIFNILMVVGATALLCPIRVSRQTVAKDIPWSILAALLLVIAASGPFLNGDANGVISRQSGLMLLCVFCVFLYYTILVAKGDKAEAAEEQEPVGEEAVATRPLWKSLLFFLGGIVGLVYGGNLFVKAASDIAFLMGLSESLVGLTIVAMGTSLPELATSVVAAYKHQTGMAIGNALGSNIFNIFLVLGASATIKPLALGNITSVDLMLQLACSFLVWIFARTAYTLSRVEGIILILIYLLYTAYLVYPAL